MAKCHNMLLRIRCKGHFSGSKKYWKPHKAIQLFTSAIRGDCENITLDGIRSANSFLKGEIISLPSRKLFWKDLLPWPVWKGHKQSMDHFLQKFCLKTLLSEHLTGCSWDNLVLWQWCILLLSRIKCLQPLPNQSAWDKTVSNVVCESFVYSSTVSTEFC